MNRKEMNPSGRPGRSFGSGNGNGCPVRKEASWVTRVSQEGTRQDGNEKSTNQHVYTFPTPGWIRRTDDKTLIFDEVALPTQQMWNVCTDAIMNKDVLPSDYEECGVCGYDHEYANSDPAAQDHIHSRHLAEIADFFKKV